jgi:hypothetical protein
VQSTPQTHPLAQKLRRAGFEGETRKEVLDDLAARLGMGEHLFGRRPGPTGVRARLGWLGRDAHGDTFPTSWMFRAEQLRFRKLG